MTLTLEAEVGPRDSNAGAGSGRMVRSQPVEEGGWWGEVGLPGREPAGGGTQEVRGVEREDLG